MSRFLEHRELDGFDLVVPQLAQSGQQLSVTDAFVRKRLLDDPAIANEFTGLAAHEMPDDRESCAQQGDHPVQCKHRNDEHNGVPASLLQTPLIAARLRG